MPIFSSLLIANSVSGSLNAGGLSINGQRETANGFMVNGADVNESIYEQTSVIPNLDSIAEFRILTSNFNAEYGNYGGGQIMVATKSGTNQLHGDAFEFLRNPPSRFRRSTFCNTFRRPIRVRFPNPSVGNPLYDWNHLIGLPGTRTRIAALTVVVPMSKRC